MRPTPSGAVLQEPLRVYAGEPQCRHKTNFISNLPGQCAWPHRLAKGAKALP